MTLHFLASTTPCIRSGLSQVFVDLQTHSHLTRKPTEHGENMGGSPDVQYLVRKAGKRECWNMFTGSERTGVLDGIMALELHFFVYTFSFSTYLGIG